MTKRTLVPAALLALTLSPFAPGLASQQESAPMAAQAEGPAIAELRIAVQDLDTKEERGYVNPGEVLPLKVGDRVRLRMVAVPAERHRAPRYPSARFSTPSGQTRIALSRVLEQEGSAIVDVLSSKSPGSPRAMVEIAYEVLEPLNLRPELRRGHIHVEIQREEPPPPPPPPPPASGARRGATLYEHQYFQGRSETFYGDDPQLSDNLIGADKASSVRVDPGCRVFLYEHPYYQGRSAELTRDEPDLGRTPVGNDRASGIRVVCNGGQVPPPPPAPAPPPPAAGRGVTLYEHQDFQGRSETFHGDDPELRDNLIGADRASSVRVDPGCEVILFEHPDYRGRSAVLERSEPDLARTRVGNDTVSSLQIRCHER